MEEQVENSTAISPNGKKSEHQYVFSSSGNFLMVVFIAPLAQEEDHVFAAHLDVDIKGDHGYLSITDWPLLPFYGSMCAWYIVMGIIWLILCARHWRDLLRIQFWIGGVIFLGMLEKAMFLAEFNNINNSGRATHALVFAAELVSCAKRTLARMLVIIVSLGFGIVKPRLGPTMHKVLGVGLLYFVLASIEAYLRINAPKNDLSSETMMAGIPLAVVDR